MPLTFHPTTGHVLICDYPKDLKPPEMVKRRPVIVVSPKLKNRNNLVTIVPLSTTTPAHIMPFHYQIHLPSPLPDPWNASSCWAICDHPMTVSFARLNLIRLPKDQYGKRRYFKYRIGEEDQNGIKSALLAAFGIFMD